MVSQAPRPRGRLRPLFADNNRVEDLLQNVCAKFFENPLGHGRSRRKSWISTPESGFPAVPMMGRKCLTPGHPSIGVGNVRREVGPNSLCICCVFIPDSKLCGGESFLINSGKFKATGRLSGHLLLRFNSALLVRFCSSCSLSLQRDCTGPTPPPPQREESTSRTPTSRIEGVPNIKI